jgi:hypothetical protein
MQQQASVGYKGDGGGLMKSMSMAMFQPRKRHSSKSNLFTLKSRSKKKSSSFLTTNLDHSPTNGGHPAHAGGGGGLSNNFETKLIISLLNNIQNEMRDIRKEVNEIK